MTQTDQEIILADIHRTAVQQDGQDPQLLANLQKLGAVQVPRGKMTYQRSNPMLNILSARKQNADAEREAQEKAARQGSGSAHTSLRNRMSVSTIVAMLDSRKECRTTKDIEELARGFDIDLDVLQRLAQTVNAPSVDANARTKRRQLGVKVEENDEVSVPSPSVLPIHQVLTLPPSPWRGLTLSGRSPRLTMSNKSVVDAQIVSNQSSARVRICNCT
jgi:hypothetical protein